MSELTGTHPNDNDCPMWTMHWNAKPKTTLLACSVKTINKNVLLKKKGMGLKRKSVFTASCIITRLVSRTEIRIRPAITSDGSNIPTSRSNRQVKVQIQVPNLKSIEFKIKLTSKPHSNLKSIQPRQFQIQFHFQMQIQIQINFKFKIQSNSNPIQFKSKPQLVKFPDQQSPNPQILRFANSQILIHACSQNTRFPDPQKPA